MFPVFGEMLSGDVKEVAAPRPSRRLSLHLGDRTETHRIDRRGGLSEVTFVAGYWIDYSRYPGSKLRQIRRSGQLRECARRRRQMGLAA